MKSKIKKLKSQRDNLKEELLNLAANDEFGNEYSILEDKLTSLNSIIDSFEKQRNKKNEIVSGGIILLTILAFLLVISNIRLSESSLQAEVFSKDLNLKLQGPLHIKNVTGATSISLTDLSEIILPDGDTIKSLENDLQLRIMGKNCRLSYFDIIPSLDISLKVNDNTMYLDADNSLLQGNLLYGDSIILEYGNNTSHPIQSFQLFTSSIENIKFKNDTTVGSNSALVIDDFNTFSILDLQPLSINFEEESELGAGNFASTIISGKIKVIESLENFDLMSTESFNFDVKRIKRFDITMHEDLIEVYMEGVFENALIKTTIYTSTLAPTVFNYVKNNQPLNALWGSLFFLFSLIWGLKRYTL